MTQHLNNTGWLRDNNTHSNALISYKEGCLAATNKKKVGDNPHDENTSEHWQWMKGFSETLSQLNR